MCVTKVLGGSQGGKLAERVAAVTVSVSSPTPLATKHCESIKRAEIRTKVVQKGVASYITHTLSQFVPRQNMTTNTS